MDNEKVLKVIQDEIAPHLNEIKKICSINKIPFFFSVAAQDDGVQTTYLSEIISPKTSGTQLSNDKITPMLNIVNGFKAVDPRYDMTFDD